MNKFLKGALCAGICLTMFGAVGCRKGARNPEKDQLKLAVGALDGNFNPFFYTAQNDAEMISMTQISMLTNDESGNLVCGDDYPTVVQSYTTTMYDANGNVTTEGDADGRTEYEFVIKKGIKFSNGEDLTIKDVLFNFYVYLDPAYTGSATMYSTDIKGLNDYRYQQLNANETAGAALEADFASKAQVRINNLIEWSEEGAISNEPSNETMKKDLATVKQLFRKEAENDWTSVYGSWAENYKNSYRFTEAWQAYFFQEGLITVQTRLNKNGATEQLYEDLNNNGKRDDGELYYTTLDPKQPDAQGTDPVGTILAQAYIDDAAAAVTDAKIDEFLAKEGNGDYTREYAKEQLEKEYAVGTVYGNYTGQRQIANILQYWATASEALTTFASEQRTEHYDNVKKNNGGELIVKTVSGITTYTNGAGNDVLKITINGIDPKAIYNFSIPIAPLSYYSGEYNGKDYVKAADGVTNFGIEFGDDKFMSQVLQSADKSGLPVGAGVYRCTNSRDSGSVNRSNFFSNNVCYFVRNDYFETVAANIGNAKIKYVNYKVYGDDKIMQALTTGEIDFGKPNATATNLNEVSKTKNLEEVHYPTGGYGYVGINPKYVPEVAVRQAIMKSMNTNMAIGFYTTALAQTITRPVSTTSWSYPNASVWQPTAFTTNTKEIENLVESAGYTKGKDGIYVKTRQVSGMSNAKTGTKLKLTFTIAGESTDHPAYSMLCTARDTLNNLGFDVTVQTDLQALKKLTSGNLAVWAAAWSSASDPDMYQVYHKDSKATSVNNWNYKNILNAQDDWEYEYKIIERLSARIEDGRSVLDTDDSHSQRAPIYADCYDMVMELAVELPIYQRNDLCVYNSKVIKGDSLVKNANFHVGLFDRIWEIEYV